MAKLIFMTNNVYNLLSYMNVVILIDPTNKLHKDANITIVIVAIVLVLSVAILFITIKVYQMVGKNSRLALSRTIIIARSFYNFLL